MISKFIRRKDAVHSFEWVKTIMVNNLFIVWTLERVTSEQKRGPVEKYREIKDKVIFWSETLLKFCCIFFHSHFLKNKENYMLLYDEKMLFWFLVVQNSGISLFLRFSDIAQNLKISSRSQIWLRIKIPSKLIRKKINNIDGI